MATSPNGPGHDPQGPLIAPPPFPKRMPLGAKLVAEVCRGSSPTSGDLVEGYYLSRSRPRRFWFLWERAVDWDRRLDEVAGRVPVIIQVVAWLPDAAVGPEDAAGAMLKGLLAGHVREFGKESGGDVRSRCIRSTAYLFQSAPDLSSGGDGLIPRPRDD